MVFSLGSSDLCRRGFICEHRINSPGKCRTSESTSSLALKEKCISFSDSAFSAAYTAAHIVIPSPWRKPYQSTFSHAGCLGSMGWQSTLQMERAWEAQHLSLHGAGEPPELLSQVAARCAWVARPQLIWAWVILKITEHSQAQCHLQLHTVSDKLKSTRSPGITVTDANNSCISISL